MLAEIRRDADANLGDASGISRREMSRTPLCVATKRGDATCRAAWLAGGFEKFNEQAALAVRAGAADVAGQVHAIAAVGATHGWRAGDERRVADELFSAMAAVAAAGNGTNRAATHVEAFRNLALR